MTQIYVPVSATVLNCQEYLKNDSKETKSFSNLPFHWKIMSISWMLCFVILSGISFQSIFFLGLLFFATLIHGLQKIIHFIHSTIWNIYQSTSKSNNGSFITFWSFFFPLGLKFLFKYCYPDFQFPLLGITLVFIVPILSVFWKSHFIPFGSLFPNYYVNTRLLVLLCIIAGQLMNIVNPHELPIYHSTPAEPGTFLIEDLTNGIIVQKTIHSIFIMSVAHTAFYFFGFFLVAYTNELPSVPLKNYIMTHIWVLYATCIHVLTICPSKDFTYITAGYATFRTQTRRFWYQFGAWGWIVAFFIVMRFLGNHPPSNKCMYI